MYITFLINIYIISHSNYIYCCYFNQTKLATLIYSNFYKSSSFKSTIPNYFFLTGLPYIFHSKASNPFTNLKKEYKGIFWQV